MKRDDSFTGSAGFAVPAMVGAAALVAMTSIIGKTLGIGAVEATGLHPFQVSAGRFGFALLALVVFLLVSPRNRPDFNGTRWGLHTARSLCGWLGVTAMFAAVANMPVAEATAISFLSPIVTIILAAILLKEHVGIRKVAASVLAMVGAALILRPGSDAFQVAGLYALAAAFLMGLEAIFIKRLSDAEPALRILIINNMIGAAVAVTVATFVWVPPTGLQWGLLVTLGVVMVCAQSLFIQSMKRGEASLVIPAFYSVLAFAAVYDLALFGVLPGVLAGAGCVLIAASAVLLSRSQRG
ncbi:MAG: DMT family transporter [Pseudomonadota bacterium]